MKTFSKTRDRGDDKSIEEENKTLIHETEIKEEKNKVHSNIKRFANILENKIVMNIAANVLILVATIFYLISLTGCEGTQAECLKKFDQTKIKYFAAILFMSGMLYTLIYNLALYKKIHYAIPIYQTVLIWYLCYIYDTGTDLKSHGQFNRTFLFAIMVVCFILQNFLFLILYLIRRKVLVGLTVFFAVTIILILYTNVRLQTSCSNWDKGLGGVQIDNNIPGCKVRIPSYCWMNLFNNVFDISGWL